MRYPVMPEDLASVKNRLLRSLTDGGMAPRFPQGQPPAVPDHTLLRRIGGGSYGEVWLARNVVGTHRAVKVVYRDRFGSARPYEREFQGMQRYEPVSRRHEGLVDILQIGRNDEAGFFYYVMELADDAAGGPPLAAPAEEVRRAMSQAASRRTSTPRTASGMAAETAAAPAIDPVSYQPRTLSSEIRRSGRLPAGDCVQAFLTLTAALSTLHRCGLLHRDLKPSNIVIVGGMPKLADIGLVAEAGGELTFVGTEGFIPPEGPGTAGADLFALGRMFYEAFTGLDRMQFPSIPASPGNMTEVKAMLELSAVAEKACAPDPKKRYQSAEEMLADLALLHSGRSVQRLRMVESRLRKARRFGLAAALAAIAAAGVVVFLQQRRAEEQRARAMLEDALAEAKLQRAVAERVAGKQGARFAVLDAVREAARSRPGDPALRTAAISALAQPDVRATGRVWAADLKGPGSATWNADGSLLAFAQKDGAVRVERAAGGVVTTVSASESMTPLMLGNSGRYLLTLGATARRLFDLTTSQVVWDLPVAGGSAALDSAAERILCFTRADGRCFVHDLATGGEREVGRITKWNPVDTAFSEIRDSRVAMVQPKERGIMLLDWKRGAVVKEWTLPDEEGVYGLSLSHDGTHVRAGSGEGTVYVFDAAEPERTVWSLKPTGAVLSGCFSLDDEVFFSSGWESVTYLFETSSGRLITSLASGSIGLSTTADGRRMLRSDGATSAIHEYEFASTVCRVRMEPSGPRNTYSPTAPCCWPGGALLGQGSWQGARLMHMHDGSLAAALPGTSAVNSLAFRADGSLLTASPAGLQQWPVSREGDLLRIGPPQYRNTIFHYVVRSDTAGRVVACARMDGVFRSLDGGEFEPLIQPPNAGNIMPRAVSVSPDGKWIAASSGPVTGIWNAQTREFHWAPRHDWEFGPVFSPDGNLLAGNDNARVWVADVAAKRLLWETSQPDGSGIGGAWSPDGRWLVMARRPDSLTIFNALNGEVWGEIAHPDSRLLTGAVFTPDGRQLIVTTSTGITQFWQIDQLRAALKELRLDLPLPDLPPPAPPVKPLRVEVHPLQESAAAPAKPAGVVEFIRRLFQRGL